MGRKKKKEDVIIRCKYIVDPYENPTRKYGFGVLFHWNDKAEVYTIIDDGGRVIQRGVGQVIFPEPKVKKDEVQVQD